MIAGIMSPSAIYAGDSTQETVAEQTGTSEADQTINEDTGTAETDVPGDAGLSSGNENSQSAADITGSDNTVISASDSANDAEEKAASEPAEASGTTADSGTVETSAESYPKVSMSVNADDGTEIQISAPEGAFPSGIQVTVTKVDSDQILSALKEASNNDALTTDQVIAYDFDFHLSSGEHNIEPEKEISVQFSLPEMKTEDSISAYHLKDENSSAEKEDITADASAGTATLETQQFSIHAFLVGTASNTTGIKIDYDDETTIHSVTDKENKIILYCMNNSLHWPHDTETIKAPTYSETSFENFFDANGITGEKQTTLKTNIEKLLYAGYPYNGYSLYEIVDSVPTISEDDFNNLLTPPQYLRDDFPKSLGNYTFTYSDRTDENKMALLKEFMSEVGDYLLGGKTASGLNYTQLMQLPFIKAANIMVNYVGDPITNYSKVYIKDYYVTEEQSYEATQDAIWTLLSRAGLVNNSAPLTTTDLVDKLINADYTNPIRTTAPSRDEVSVTGNLSFYYSTADKKWHTDPLTLSVPPTYRTYFNLALPNGITEETGKTQVKGGENFSLVSSSKPDDSISIELTSTIPWMDPDLKVYVADSTVKDSEGKGFQNMIGAVIHQVDITKTVYLSTSITTPEAPTTPSVTTTPEVTTTPTAVPTPSKMPEATVTPSKMPEATVTPSKAPALTTTPTPISTMTPSSTTSDTLNVGSVTTPGSGDSSSKGSARTVKTGEVSTGDNLNTRIWQASLTAAMILLVILLFMTIRSRRKHR